MAKYSSAKKRAKKKARRSSKKEENKRLTRKLARKVAAATRRPSGAATKKATKKAVAARPKNTAKKTGKKKVATKKRARAAAASPKKATKKRARAAAASPKKATKKRARAAAAPPKKKRARAAAAPPKKATTRARRPPTKAAATRNVRLRASRSQALTQARLERLEKARVRTKDAERKLKSDLKKLRQDERALKKLSPKLRKRKKKALAKRRKRLETKREALQQAKAANRRERRRVERLRLQQQLVREDLPRATPAQVQASREELRQRQLEQFMELLRIARETNQLPDPSEFARWFDTRKIEGQQVVVRYNMLVIGGTPEEGGTIREIGERASRAVQGMQARSNYPFWMAVLVFAGMGERLVGYVRRVLHNAEVPNADQLYTEAIDNTGVYPTPNQMLAAFNGLLEEYASEQNTLVYLQYVRFMNFTRKEWLPS